MVINHFLASRIQFQFLYRTKVCVCMCDQLVCALVQSSVSYAAGERDLTKCQDDLISPSPRVHVCCTHSSTVATQLGSSRICQISTLHIYKCNLSANTSYTSKNLRQKHTHTSTHRIRVCTPACKGVCMHACRYNGIKICGSFFLSLWWRIASNRQHHDQLTYIFNRNKKVTVSRLRARARVCVCSAWLHLWQRARLFCSSQGTHWPESAAEPRPTSGLLQGLNGAPCGHKAALQPHTHINTSKMFYFKWHIIWLLINVS